MIVVQSFGSFDYQIIGEREAEAAQEFQSVLDFISRQYWMPSESVLDDISDARQRIESKYHVKIETSV